MALKGIQVCSALFATLLFAVAVNAQSDCTNVIISLSPCLNYLTGNSSTPSSACCSQLSTVVRSKPECLCQALTDDSSAAALNISKTQALELPKACNVQTPSTSKCNSAGSPSGAPSGTPDSPTTPASECTMLLSMMTKNQMNQSPSKILILGGGSKIPSTDGDISHATSTTFQFYVLFMSLLVASIA